MASLTPGTLEKLLQNVGNKDFKVADDPWKSSGYFLRVSDSVHSAYVSVSDDDVELILNDNIQLGQFIHVTWLDLGSPVPVLRGLKPIPKRRPCVGDPKDLISSDFLNAKKVETKVKSKGKVKKVVEDEEGIVRSHSLNDGKVGGLEGGRLSLDSARKGWDRSPRSKNGGSGARSLKSKDNRLRSESVVANKVIHQDSPNGSNILPLKSKNITVSSKHLSMPVMKTVESSDDGVFPCHLDKVVVGSKMWSDSKILWDSLPSTICDLGKEIRSYRNGAFVSAIRALEEASMYESVLQCMSMFAELCESSQKNSSSPLVEQFLNLHESMKKASIVISSKINVKTSNPEDGNGWSSQFPELGNHLPPATKNASLWVQAAIQTDLSKFSLYRKGEEKGITDRGKCHYLVIDDPEDKIDTKNHSSNKKNTVNHGLSKFVAKVNGLSSHSGRLLSNAKGQNGQEAWSEGSGLRQVSNLAQNMLSLSHSWFLDYLEDSLNNGFRLKTSNDTSQVGVLLGQLKRVNQWLDEVIREGDGVDERIEMLKKKLYGFLLDHVDSTVHT
ncbi:hypothetical protein CDL12_02116 [Handroanthus impetiginosus]|uniref:Uncharacterized protein n=1 Tax=Handroanthus impetiginosus TaxID=429701 RepID=A0A2G9I5V5_9LAMI|nr:hypothetical protein CDL12_02116 [Handroanthus impetiginosus]